MQLTRESILVNSLRSFCVAFAAVLGIALSIFLIVFLFTSASAPSLVPEKSDLSLRPDAEGRDALLPLSHPALLRIDIHGTIGCDDLTTENVEKILLDSEQDLLLKNQRIKGILLHLDTPGGTVVDAEGIYRALLAYKNKHHIPIYALVDGTCASGGVYVASTADKIYATPVSVYGSVGVLLGPNFNVSQAMEKYGISAQTFTEGKNKDALNPFRPWKPEEQQPIKDIVSALYERFVAIVTAARPLLDKTKLIQEYGANVYIAAQAQSLGYIDEANSTYASALTALATAAGIPEKETYQVVTLSPPRPFFSQFMDSECALFTGKITHALQLGAFKEELYGKFLYLYQ